MAYRRILTIQDISCVGQCSMTVAMPILCACGHETCILPTSLLSTHTGGFGKPEFIHLDNGLDGFWQHWKAQGITFDAILVGYLGSVAAVKMVQRLLHELLSPDGISIVDPAMADHGRIYSGFDEAYANAMMALCQQADVILPNITEAAMMASLPYRASPDKDYIHALLKRLNHKCVILTGTAFREGETGIAMKEAGQISYYFHPRLEGSYHGTGDMFAAAFTGALMQGKTKLESVKIAADFVCKAIENTQKHPAHWYGVKFETALPYLFERLQDNVE